MRNSGLAILVALWAISSASAQAEVWQFRWRTGNEFNYHVKHTTTVKETLRGNASTTTSKLDIKKRWRVLSVNEKGIATLQMAIVALRNEQIRGDGEVLLFDSEQPEKSTPVLKNAMMKFIGKPLVVLQVDAGGNVIDAKPGPLSKYQSELPFLMVLPKFAVGRGWRRTFTITLNPPHGTGEKFAAAQTYTIQSQQGSTATLALKTTLKNPPPGGLDQVPLLPKLLEGTIVFDHINGRMVSGLFRITRTLENHQGPDSRYYYESNYLEQLVK